MRVSSALRLMLPAMRSMKSKRSAKSPFLSLSPMIALTTLSPKPFMPPRPKRMSPSRFTEKVAADSFTSGLSTLIPLLRQSAMISFISSMLEMFWVRLDAWNSEG